MFLTGEVYILTSSKSVAQSHSGKLYKLLDPKRYYTRSYPHTNNCMNSVSCSGLYRTDMYGIGGNTVIFLATGRDVKLDKVCAMKKLWHPYDISS